MRKRKLQIWYMTPEEEGQFDGRILGHLFRSARVIRNYVDPSSVKWCCTLPLLYLASELDSSRFLTGHQYLPYKSM